MNMLGKVYLVLSLMLLAAGDGSAPGFFQSQVCINNALLVGFILLPAEDITTWLSEKMGITKQVTHNEN